MPIPESAWQEDFCIRTDCKHFIGEKPCRFARLCGGCPHHEAMGTRILIIKFGALGDVLRTTPLLTGLRRQYPIAHITWLTDEPSAEILRDTPGIDRLYVMNALTLPALLVQQFDLCLNLDKVIQAVSVAMLVQATHKMGFGLTREGSIYPLNPEARYNFLLGLSDELKFRQNQKSYQEFTFETCALQYQREEYVFCLQNQHLDYAQRFRDSHGIGPNDVIIGLNTGSGEVFATKKWTIEGYAELTRLLLQNPRFRVILMGGPAELARNEEIRRLSGTEPLLTDGRHSIKEFAGLIRGCHLLVTGDTLALHLAIAQKTPVLAIFGSTCHQEVDLYGRGAKLVADVPCAPCYRSVCPGKGMVCMKSLSPRTVYDQSIRLLPA